MRPNIADLPVLRKGLRKRLVPRVSRGFRGSEPGVGEFVFYQQDADFRAEWLVGASERIQPWRVALFTELCIAPAMELERLELGWLIADIAALQGRKVANSIERPSEAMRQAAPYWKNADEWRHWAIVAPGHMKFAKQVV